MTQVFVSYANKDRDSVLPIIEALNQAGLNAWSDHSIVQGGAFEQQIERVIASAECVIVFWSEAAAKSEWVQKEIRLAIRAWSYDRLLLATLDSKALPVGLRDVPAIPIQDANCAATKQLIERAKVIAELPMARAAERQAKEIPSSVARSPRFGSIIAALAGVLVICLTAVLAYQKSLGPDLDVDLDVKSYVNTGFSLSFILMLLVLGAVIGAGAVWASISWSRRRSNHAPSTALTGQRMVWSTGAPQVFVSYSTQDEKKVEQLVQQLEQMGYSVYIDRRSTGPQRYAVSIVQAIRMSRLIALMCSRSAFASDHVIREIYVAGDCKKPFIAFQLDATEFPDEVLYFVSGFPRIPIATIDAQKLRSEIARLLAV